MRARFSWINKRLRHGISLKERLSHYSTSRPITIIKSLFRHGDHFLGTLDGDVGNVDARQESGNFGNLFFIVQMDHGGVGTGVIRRFFDSEVVVSVCRNLRKMGDGDNLPVFRKGALRAFPTMLAVSPLIPLSISSKIMVGMPSYSPMIFFRASMILDISPPDAILDRGFMVSPTLVLMRNPTLSMPLGVKDGSSSKWMESSTLLKLSFSNSSWILIPRWRQRLALNW